MESNSTIQGNHRALGNNDSNNSGLKISNALGGLSNLTLCQDFSLETTDIIVAVVLYSITAIGGSLGNFLVLLVISRTPHLKANSCSVFILNLAIADLLVTATIPLIISVITKGFVPLCSLNTSMLAAVVLGRFSAAASLLILAAMSMDRCWAVCYPIHHRVKMTSSKLKAVIALIWLASLVVPILEVVLPRQGRWPLIFKHLKNFCVVCCYIAIVTSGLAIFINVRCASLKIDDLYKNGGNDQMCVELRERNKKVVKTIALVVVVFSVCWLPVTFINTRFVEHYSDLHFWSALLGMANSAMNPCIYFYRHGSYRQELKELIGFCHSNS